MISDNVIVDRFRRLSGAAVSIREVCEQACLAVVEEGSYRMAWVGRLNARTREVEPIISWGHDEGYVEKLRVALDGTKRGIGPTGAALRERRPVVNRDFRTNIVCLPWRDEALKRGYISSVALPVIIGKQVWGTLNVYSGEPARFDPERVRVLTQVAAELASALARVIDPEDLAPEPQPEAKASGALVAR